MVISLYFILVFLGKLIFGGKFSGNGRINLKLVVWMVFYFLLFLGCYNVWIDLMSFYVFLVVWEGNLGGRDLNLWSLIWIYLVFIGIDFIWILRVFCMLGVFCCCERLVGMLGKFWMKGRWGGVCKESWVGWDIMN